MKKILLLIICLFTFPTINAQEVENSPQRQPDNRKLSMRGASVIGVKIGYVVGVNYEYYFTNRSSIEADVEYDFNLKGLTVMPLYKFHFNIGAGFSGNVGGGVNLSWFNLGYKPIFVFGFDPTVGIDYNFTGASIGVYYRPQINLGYINNWANFGVKFGFNI